MPGYILAQLIGGILASSVIALVLAGRPDGFAAAQEAGFASNGFGEGSPGGYGLAAVFVAEAVLTGIFLAVILSVTAKAEYQAFAPIGIGLTLTLIHLISIPISNTSVNPARSIATAVYGGTLPLSQLWVFIVAPIAGGPRRRRRGARAGSSHRHGLIEDAVPPARNVGFPGRSRVGRAYARPMSPQLPSVRS